MLTLELSSDEWRESLSVRSFSVQEAVSSLFQVSIVALSESSDIDLESIVGKAVTFRLTTFARDPARATRQWKGIVSRIEQIRIEVSQRGRSTYSLLIAPKLWLLTQRRDYRVFQHLSIPDIVEKVLSEWKIPRAWKIDAGAYPKLEYKVQYGETPYAFLSRLLEEAGIAFTFDASETGACALTLDDALTSGDLHPSSPVHFEDTITRVYDKEFVTKVQMSHSVRPGAFTIRDHDLRNPAFALFAHAPKAKPPEDSYEQYHYRPGAFLVEGGAGAAGGMDTIVADDKGVARHDQAAGARRAERSLAASRVDKRQITFETNLHDLTPGVLFSLDNHLHPALKPDRRLLVTHSFITGTPLTLGSMGGKAVFADTPYRPAHLTPRPEARGVESATVVGPRGEEIYTDEFGRVRVQFPWDREGKSDDNSSCWIRVSQGWAEAGFGMIAIPRVGQEVLVSFLGGDPDQPVIVGRVFNAISLTPYKLPEHKTVSAWKSSSSPGGGGYSELLFEDKKGEELVYMQAERDLRKLVKHDETMVTRGHQALLVGAGQEIVVKEGKKERVEGDSHLHVTADQRRQVDGKESISVGGSRQEKIGESHALLAGQEIHLKAGTTVVIEAANLTLKDLTGNFIHIGPGGVEIVGTFVRINSGGMAGSGSGASPDAPDEAAEAVVEPPDAAKPSA